MTAFLRFVLQQPDPQPLSLRFRLQGVQAPSLSFKLQLSQPPEQSLTSFTDRQRLQLGNRQIYVAYFDGERVPISTLNIDKQYGSVSTWRITSPVSPADASAIVGASAVRIAGGFATADGGEILQTIISGPIERVSINQSADGFSVNASGSKYLVPKTVISAATIRVGSTTNNPEGSVTGGGSFTFVPSYSFRPLFGAKTIAAPSKIFEITEENNEIEQIRCELRMSIGIGDRLILEDGRPLVAGAINYTVSSNSRQMTISKLNLDDAYNKGSGTEYLIGNELYQRVPWVRGESVATVSTSSEYL